MSTTSTRLAYDHRMRAATGSDPPQHADDDSDQPRTFDDTAHMSFDVDNPPLHHDGSSGGAVGCCCDAGDQAS